MMRNRTTWRMLLAVWAIPAGFLHADSFEVRVKHDHFWKSCEGRLLANQQEIRYEAADGKHSRSWSYIDIQKVDLISPTRIEIKTFRSSSWKKLEQDEVFGFSLLEGQLTIENQEFLRSKLSRPMVARLAEKKDMGAASLPVRHRHRLGGCEGELRIETERVVYTTEHAGDSRVWQLGEIETIGASDPYHFRLTSYNETFTFDLKSPLDLTIYESLWKKVYKLEQVHATREF